MRGKQFFRRKLIALDKKAKILSIFGNQGVTTSTTEKKR